MHSIKPASNPKKNFERILSWCIALLRLSVSTGRSTHAKSERTFETSLFRVLYTFYIRKYMNLGCLGLTCLFFSNQSRACVTQDPQCSNKYFIKIQPIALEIIRNTHIHSQGLYSLRDVTGSCGDLFRAIYIRIGQKGVKLD